MKGTILVCLRDMLRDECGMTDTQWQDMLEAVGLDRYRSILLASDVDDAHALGLFGEAQKRFYPSFLDIANAYGKYWSVIYAPKVYASVYSGVKNAREFILKMDKVHVMVTQTMENATPPRFTFEEVGSRELLVHYKSGRGLIHLYAGLARGIGTYFNEKLTVSVVNDEKVSIVFPA